jgi:uncharacterized protein
MLQPTLYTTLDLGPNLPPQERWRFHLRQLQWLLCTPTLLTRNAGSAFGNHAASAVQMSVAQIARAHAWLANLRDASPVDIGRWLPCFESEPGQMTLRLGRYAERLLGFYLKRGGDYVLQAEHLQWREPDPATGFLETKGEFDFIVRDADQQLQHWELAVKFFLCTAKAQADDATPVNCSAQDFVGPDGRDSLHRKLIKLFQRQLCHPLPPPFQSQPVQRSTYSAGWLFYR